MIWNLNFNHKREIIVIAIRISPKIVLLHKQRYAGAGIQESRARSRGGEF